MNFSMFAIAASAVSFVPLLIQDKTRVQTCFLFRSVRNMFSLLFTVSKFGYFFAFLSV